jgi:glycosyltransferase involved in cell wall biosynthesis
MTLRTKPGITVAIPTFNRLDWLKIAVQSALAETRVPITVHVFDNGSTDGTVDYMQSLASSDQNVIYTRNAENVGAIGNYTLSMHHVRTRYFVPLADDDFLLPDFLFKAFQILEADPSLGAAVFVNEARREDGSVANTYPFEPDRIPNGRMEPGEHLRNWMANGHYHWSSTLWRSETLDFVGYPYLHTGLPSDVDFQGQVFCKYPVVFVNAPGSVYRLHGEQVSTNYGVATLMQWANLFRRLDRRAMKLNVLPLAEYTYLRSGMANRYRGLWQGAAAETLSDSKLERLAVVAGFQLGDWEFALSLFDELKGRSGNSHRLAGVLQLETLRARDTSVADDVSRMSVEISRLQEARSQVETERNEMLQSTSWRITAPLRWIKYIVG